MSKTIDITSDQAIGIIKKKTDYRLPQRVADVGNAMLTDAEPGKSWLVADVAKDLGMHAGGAQFGHAVASISRMFIRKGYALTTRGTNGEKLHVREVKHNHRVAANKCRLHIKGIAECAMLAHATAQLHADKLSAQEVRRLEKQADIMALRYLFAKRVR